VEQAHEADAARQSFLESVGVEPAVVREGQDLDPDPPLHREPLPNDEVRVVLPVGDEDPVSRLPWKALTDQVDRLGSVPQEDDPSRVRAAEEPGERRPGRFVATTDLFGVPVEAPARAPGEFPVVLLHCLENDGRHERHARRVEVRGGPTTVARSQRWELCADLRDVHGGDRWRLSAAATRVVAPTTSALSSGANVAL
jgi:hypothetical protein